MLEGKQRGRLRLDSSPPRSGDSSWQWFVQREKIASSELSPLQLAEGDARVQLFLLPRHPAFLRLSPWYRCRRWEPWGVRVDGWSHRGWLLRAGNKAEDRRRGWWNKRLVAREKRPGREHGMLEKWWKRAQKKGSGIKTLKVRCRIFLAQIKGSCFRKSPLPFSLYQHCIFCLPFWLHLVAAAPVRYLSNFPWYLAGMRPFPQEPERGSRPGPPLRTEAETAQLLCSAW